MESEINQITDFWFEQLGRRKPHGGVSVPILCWRTEREIPSRDNNHRACSLGLKIFLGVEGYKPKLTQFTPQDKLVEGRDKGY